jgi:hypothetical protein
VGPIDSDLGTYPSSCEIFQVLPTGFWAENVGPLCMGFCPLPDIRILICSLSIIYDKRNLCVQLFDPNDLGGYMKRDQL